MTKQEKHIAGTINRGLLARAEKAEANLAAAHESFRELREKFDDALLKFAQDLKTTLSERDAWRTCASELKPWAQDALEELATHGLEYAGQAKCKAVLDKFAALDAAKEAP